TVIPEQKKREAKFQDSVNLLKDEFYHLLSNLKRDVPVYSPRYIGHMLGDQLIPAVLGYFATLLYNPNNVTSDVSPFTTRLEVEVGRQLAELVGYGDEHPPWGHITSGGTVANFEGIWAARNLKYLPLAMRRTAAELGIDIDVILLDGKRRLIQKASQWELLNLRVDEIVCIKERLISACSEKRDISVDEAFNEIDEMLSKYTISNLGIQAFFAREDIKNTGVILTSATAHYSLGKIAQVLGIGIDNIVPIDVDSRFRMDIKKLDEALSSCLNKSIPVIAVIPICGSSEEGSVDPIDEVISLRERLEERHGMSFLVHIDAAYGGYVRTMFVDKNGRRRSRKAILAETGDWPSEEVYRSFMAFNRADSIAMDPHKLGYIPYPAGAIIFRNGKTRDIISSKAHYVFHEGDREDSYIGRYIFEGSKPGASASACWLAHRVVPLNSSGYGAIIGKSIKGAMMLFEGLGKISKGLERSGVLLKRLEGPDINIVCFLVNEKNNRSLKVMNSINNSIYNRLKFNPKIPIQDHNFIISKTELTFDKYKDVMAPYVKKLGILPGCFIDKPKREGQAERVTILRCTVMNPWFGSGYSKGGRYLDQFTDELKVIIEEIIYLLRSS
ncbi:MAG: pyridoxal-dependent decarboxylase, partial [Nitrospirota bacterium]